VLLLRRKRRDSTAGKRSSPPRRAIGLIALLLCLASQPAAEEAGEYRLEFLSDGSPRYTQVLRWESDPYVLFYVVTLQTAAGEKLSEFKAAESALSLSLGPGEYRYRITAYNALRKPEIEFPWREFSVLKAELPRVVRYEPKIIYIEDATASLTLWGEYLAPGARVALQGGDPSIPSFEGKETAREGTSDGASADRMSEVRFSFPAGSLPPGEYSLMFTNPGGLSTEVRAALVVRHKLGEPRSLEPATGSVFGPTELRGLKAIGFSWDGVKEAVRYVFSLYPRGEPDRPVRRLVIPGTSYLLDDLTVLDRGDFRWSVEAQGIDTEGKLIPAVGAAVADFRIDLPHTAYPDLSATGDTFYGR
jgi:hypothetical protein